MSYSIRTVRLIEEAPRTLGNQLGRWAVHHELTAAEVSLLLGTSRQTIYNWFTGKHTINNAYRNNAEKLLNILIKAKDHDDAWSTACQAFNINL